MALFFLSEIEKTDSQIHVELQGTLNSQSNIEKEK